jgi:hypothetical protein
MTPNNKNDWQIFFKLLEETFLKYTLFKELHKKKSNHIFSKKINQEIILPSLNENFFLSLAKFFDDNNATFGVKDILKNLNEEKKELFKKKFKIIKPKIICLYQWRNKKISHNDKKYLFHKKIMQKHYEIHYLDFEHIFTFLIELLEENPFNKPQNFNSYQEYFKKLSLEIKKEIDKK